MAQYTLAEAAKATGKSKSTILRSIRAGRISAVRDELSGGWLVEPAELHRLYAEHDAVRGAANDEARNGYRNGGDSLISGAMAALHTRIAVAEAELRLKDEIITELRRSIALLTDQRAVPSTGSTVQPVTRRRGWRRLFRR